mgnify:CR=1 FL=1
MSLHQRHGLPQSWLGDSRPHCYIEGGGNPWLPGTQGLGRIDVGQRRALLERSTATETVSNFWQRWNPSLLLFSIPSLSPLLKYYSVWCCAGLCCAGLCCAVLDRIRTERGGAHATPSPKATHVRCGEVLERFGSERGGPTLWSDPANLRFAHVCGRRRRACQATHPGAITGMSTVLLHAVNSHKSGRAEYLIRRNYRRRSWLLAQRSEQGAEGGEAVSLAVLVGDPASRGRCVAPIRVRVARICLAAGPASGTRGVWG